jgi:two-component system CheB/CheR fusion protein
MTDADNDLKQVVAIGASAGGLAALQAMLPGLPIGQGVAYVLAQHMDPAHPSMLDRILQRDSRLDVKEAASGERLAPDSLYIVPPDKEGSVVDSKLQLDPADHPHGPRHTVDILFASVAKAYRERSVGIVLSGSGSDGLQGVRAIKAAQGVAIVQDPQSAQYTGMPGSIVHERLADVVVSPERIGEELVRVLNWPEKTAVLPGSEADVFQALVRALVRKTGISIDQYKETTLRRRIERRRIVTRQEDLARYLQYVEESDTEADALLQDMLISVTEFFRDPGTFDAIRSVIKSLVAAKSEGDTIRLWVPGCATGEEAFSIAMLLAEELGDARRSMLVQIFATDIDEQAIQVARKSVYLKTALKDVPAKIVDRYFTRTDGTFRVASSIRDMVTFAKHDLMQDPPFSRLDLVSCRNVLIYFKRQTQERLISTFHYVLNPGGYLVLGPSETVGALSELFESIDHLARLFRRRDLETLPPALLRTKQAAPNKFAPAVPAAVSVVRDIDKCIRDVVYDRYAPPSVVVDQRFNLLHTHGDISEYVKLPQGDISVNILDMVAGALRVELRLLLQKAERQPNLLRSTPIAYETRGKKTTLQLTAIPVEMTPGNGQQTLVLFDARPMAERVAAGAPQENAAFRIRELEQELTATRDHLQTNIEELEASNEELQSVNEEYQSTTEELQSANEELQTTNEELQSTNEELNTVNEELRVRSGELASANNDLESILNTVVAGIVVLDKDLRVSRYSSASREIFDLLPTSIGRPLISVGGTVDLAVLSSEIQRALSGARMVERELELGDRSFLVRFLPQQHDDEVGGLVISFLEITEPLAAAREARRLLTVLKDSSDAITVQTPEGDILSWNGGAETMYGYDASEALTMNIREIVPPAERGRWQAALDRIFEGRPSETIQTVRRHRDGHQIDVSIAISALLDEAGRPYALATTERDITSLLEAEQHRRQAEFAHEARVTTIGEMAAGLAHELTQPITSVVHFCDVAAAIARKFDPKRQDELNEVLSDATAQAQRAGAIIHNLRRFLGRRGPLRTVQSINEITERASRFLADMCTQHGVSVRFSLAKALPPVAVDATQIEQVLVNLIRNGIEAIAEADSERREIVIETQRDNNLVGSVQVTVRDSGPGFDPETAERLFEPFRTDKPNGLGMGLWISRSLVESHGGRLWCDEAATGGAAFHFSLPVADEEEAPRDG